MLKKINSQFLVLAGVLFYLFFSSFQDFKYGKFRNNWRKENNLIQIPKEWKCRFGNTSITCNDPKRKGSADKIGYFNKYIIIRKNGETEEIDRIKLGDVNLNFNFLKINTLSLKKEIIEVDYILQYINNKNVLERNKTISKTEAFEMMREFDLGFE